MKALTILLGIAEFAFVTWLLDYIFTSLVAHDISMALSFSVIVFLLWLGKKLDNMSGGATDGK